MSPIDSAPSPWPWSARRTLYLRPGPPFWCPRRVMQTEPSQEERWGHVPGPAPPGTGAVGGGEKGLSGLWLMAEAGCGEWGWILGSRGGGSPCAFQPPSALLACLGPWGCRMSWGGAEPP